MALGKSWPISWPHFPHLQHGWVRLCSQEGSSWANNFYEADGGFATHWRGLYLSSGSLYLIPGSGLGGKPDLLGLGLLRDSLSGLGRLCQHPQALHTCVPEPREVTWSERQGPVGRQGAVSPASPCRGCLCPAAPAVATPAALLRCFQTMASQRSALEVMLEGTGVNGLDSSKSRTVRRKVSSNLQPQ